MTINISASTFKITDDIRDHVERRLLPLSQCEPRALSALVTLDRCEDYSGQRFLIKTQVDLGGRRASQTCHSVHLYEGIDLAARELIGHLCKSNKKQDPAQFDTEAEQETAL